MEEVSRGGIGLLDEKKLDMILAESRRFYPEKANESLVRRTISTYVCQTRGQMRAQGKKNVIFFWINSIRWVLRKPHYRSDGPAVVVRARIARCRARSSCLRAAHCHCCFFSSGSAHVPG